MLVFNITRLRKKLEIGIAKMKMMKRLIYGRLMVNERFILTDLTLNQEKTTLLVCL